VDRGWVVGWSICGSSRLGYQLLSTTSSARASYTHCTVVCGREEANRYRGGRDGKMSMSETGDRSRNRGWKEGFGFWCASFVGAVVCIGAVTASLWVRCGSVAGIVSFVQGEQLAVDEMTKYLYNADAKRVIDVKFTLRNLTNRTGKIVGAKATCGCMRIKGLPAVIEKRGTFTLNVSVKPREKREKFDEYIDAYTSFEKSPRVRLRIIGDIHGR